MAHFPRKTPLPEPLWNVSLLPTATRRRVGSSLPPQDAAGALAAPAVLSLREGESTALTARAA